MNTQRTDSMTSYRDYDETEGSLGKVNVNLPRLNPSDISPRVALGVILAGLAIGAAIYLMATPHGRELRTDLLDRGQELTDHAGKRLNKATKRGRHSLDDLLDRSRKELAKLEDQGRDRAGDLRHRAQIMRKRSLLRRLERELML